MTTARKHWIAPEWYGSIAIVCSLMIHIMLFIIPNPAPAKKAQFSHDKGIKVVLVNAKTDTNPPRSKLLAQNALDGGGDQEQELFAQSLHPSLSPYSSEEQENKSTKMVETISEQEQQLLQQLEALERSIETQQRTSTNSSATSTPTPITADQVAALSKEIQAFNQRPRKHFFAPSTSEYRFAAYVHQWERRIETVGTANYPEEAKGHIYGQLRLTVYVRSNGTVVDVEIDSPSPYNVLNKAALKIIQLAQPFDPFPPSIARDTDIIAITRTWNFTNNTISTSQ